MKKSIFYVILTFLILQIGQGAVAALSYLWFDSFACSLCVSVLFFSAPFLYLLFKKTRVSIVSREPDIHNSKGFPLLKLIVLSIGLVLINLFMAKILNTHSNGQEGDTATILETTTFALETTLLAPVVEEMFYRKWMISYLERSKVKPAIILILSSFLFFFAHTNWTNMSFRFDTLIFGIVLFYIYTKYRDVRCCILVHSLNNLILTAIAILSR